MQSLKDKLVQAGVIPEDYRPGETPAQRSARLSREQGEKRIKIAEIVAGARVVTTRGENVFFFTTRSRKMRRLLLEDGAKSALEKGECAVVEWPNQPDFPWAVVPRDAAERILGLDPIAVRFYLRSEKEQFGVEPPPSA